VGAHLAQKVGVLLGLSVAICVPYFTLQRLDWFPVRTVPLTPLDGWIPFEPAWDPAVPLDRAAGAVGAAAGAAP